MGRPSENKTLFNAKLKNSTINRIKLICFRRSVAANHKLSEARLIGELVAETRLPPPPTKEQIEAYGREAPELLPEDKE